MYKHPDLISREAAISAAIEAADNWDGGCSPNRESYITMGMNDVPAVDAIPVEWLWKKLLTTLESEERISASVVFDMWQKEQEAR